MCDYSDCCIYEASQPLYHCHVTLQLHTVQSKNSLRGGVTDACFISSSSEMRMKTQVAHNIYAATPPLVAAALSKSATVPQSSKYCDCML